MFNTKKVTITQFDDKGDEVTYFEMTMRKPIEVDVRGNMDGLRKTAWAIYARNFKSLPVVVKIGSAKSISFLFTEEKLD